MKSLLTWLLVVFLGLMFQTSNIKTSDFNHRFSESQSQRKHRPGKRNPKFIIPALISHMYHQKLDESPLSTILNRPSAKSTSKQETEKRQSADHLEHKVIVGNPRRDEHVRNVPKTKCPGVRRKESPVVLEAQSHRQGDHNSCSKLHKGDSSDGEGNVIQVSKNFSPIGRNWYAGPPSVMWPPPPPPYPNTYSMPLEQYPNLRYSRPFYPGHSAFQQEGIIQHIMGQPRNRFLGVANLKDNTVLNQNIVAQEKKFMVTNITKYVLDFYCPHCGGEISVSKNRNRGGLFAPDQGSISINKGMGDLNSSKGKTTTSYSFVTKVQQLN